MAKVISVLKVIRSKLRLCDVPYSWQAAALQMPFLLICWYGIWWVVYQLTPYPSLSIAFLAVVAVIMTVRAPDFIKTEQVIWVIIAFLLFGIESKFVIQDRNETAERQEADSRAQQAQFLMILRQNQAGFSATMNGVSEVFDKTKEAADTATTAVNNITGGSSFCYLPGLQFEHIRTFSPNISFAKSAHAWLIKRGRFPLTDVTLYLTLYIGSSWTTSPVNLPNMGAGNSYFADPPPNENGSAGPDNYLAIPLPFPFYNGRIDLLLEFTGKNGTWREVVHGHFKKGKEIEGGEISGSWAMDIKVIKNNRIVLSQTDANFDKTDHYLWQSH